MLRVSGAGRCIGLDPFAALDEEMRKDLARFVQGDPVFRQILFEIRAEHLVDPADPGPVAAKSCKREREPQALHGFTESPRRFKRDTAKHRGDFRIVLPLSRQIPRVPDPHGIDHPAQIPLHRSGTVFVDVVQNAVHAALQHTIETDRNVAHRPQHRLAVKRDRNDMGDRTAQSRGTADFLPGDEPDRCPSRDFVYGVGVPLRTIHFRKAGHCVHRNRLVCHCVVAVHSMHRTIGKRTGRLRQPHRPRISCTTGKFHNCLLLCRGYFFHYSMCTQRNQAFFTRSAEEIIMRRRKKCGFSEKYAPNRGNPARNVL